MSVIEKIMCGKAFPAAGLTGRPVAEPAVERTIETLQRYHRLGVLCLAAGILWLILAIFLYMYFRMGRVIGSLTGYRERKAIRKWEETELLRIECKKDEKPGKRGRGRRLLWTLVLAGSMLGAAEVSAEEAGEEPRVEIHCGEPGRVLGETQYYREDVELQILVLRKGEESPEEPERELKVYCTERYTGERQELTGAVSWRDTEEGREGSWRLTREGTFRLTVEMEQGETDVQEWSSPWLVLDKTPPRLWAELSEEPEKVLDGKSCFRTATVLRIQVEDAHWRVQELKEALEGLRVTGERGADVTEESKCRKRIRELDGGEQPEGLWQWELPIREDGCFDIPVGLTDLAGNPAVWAEPDSRPEEERFQIMLDREGPKLELTGLSGETGTAGFGSYAPDGVWFSDGKLLLRCRALDEVSGLTELRVRVTGENGEERILEPNEEADETDEHTDEEQILGTGALSGAALAGGTRTRKCNAGGGGQTGEPDLAAERLYGRKCGTAPGGRKHPDSYRDPAFQSGGWDSLVQSGCAALSGDPGFVFRDQKLELAGGRAGAEQGLSAGSGAGGRGRTEGNHLGVYRGAGA